MTKDEFNAIMATWLDAQERQDSPLAYMMSKKLLPTCPTPYDAALEALRAGRRDEARRLVADCMEARMIWEVYPSLFCEQTRGMRKVRGVRAG